MTPAERDEATAVAAALIGFVIDSDSEGAEILLTHTSHQVIAQVCTDLAFWIAGCVEGDLAEFRASLTEQLQRWREGHL